MANALMELFIRLGLDAAPLSAGLAQTVASVNSTAASINSAGASMGNAFDPLGHNVATVSDSVKENVKSAEETMREFGRSMAATGALVSGISVPLLELGKDAIQTAGQFEQTQIAFKAFLGSASAAGTFLENLYSFATHTPFQIQGLTIAARQLMAVGYSAESIIPMLTTLGNAASGLGKGQVGLNNMVKAFQNMNVEANLMKRDMNMLAHDGIAAFDILAKGMDMSVGQLTTAIRKGLVPAAQAIPILLAGINEKFGGMMGAQMNSLLGMWTNFKDNVTLTLKAIGDQLLPYGKQFVGFATDAMASIKDTALEFGKLSDPIKASIVAFLGLTAAAGPLLVALGGVILLLGYVSAPVLLATAGIVALGAALAGLYVATKEQLPGVQAVFVAAFHDIENLAKAAWAGLKTLWSEGLRDVVATVAPFEAMLVDHWQGALNAVRAFSVAFWHELTDNWGRSARQLAESIIPGFTLLTAILDKLPHSDFGKVFGDAVKAGQDARELSSALDLVTKSSSATGASMKSLGDLKTQWMDEHQAKLAALGNAVTVLANNYGATGKGYADYQKAVAAVTAEYGKQYVATVRAKEGTDDILKNRSIYKDANNNFADYMKGVKAVEKAHSDAAKATEKWKDGIFDLADEAQKAGNLMERYSPNSWADQLAEMVKIPEFEAAVHRTDLSHALGFQSSEELGRMAANAKQQMAEVNADVHFSLMDRLDATEHYNELIQRSNNTWLENGSTKLKWIADQWKEVYRSISTTVGSSAHDNLVAWDEMVGAQIQSGERLSAATVFRYEFIKDRVQANVDSMTRMWLAFADAAKKAWDGLTRDLGAGLADAIVEGKKLGDVFQKVFKDIAKTIIEVVIQQGFARLLDTLANVHGALGKVAQAMGGIASPSTAASGASGNIVDALKGIWSGGGAAVASAGTDLYGEAIPVLTKVAGATAEIPGALKTIAGTVTDAAKKTAAATGTFGGLLSAGTSATIGLVTGAVSAISGIIGNFQQAAANAKLGGIQQAVTRLDIATTQGPLSLEPGLAGQQNDIATWTLGTYHKLIDVVDRLQSLRDAIFDPIAVRLDWIHADLAGLRGGPIAAGAGGQAFVFNNYGSIGSQADIDSLLNQMVAKFRAQMPR